MSADIEWLAEELAELWREGEAEVVYEADNSGYEEMDVRPSGEALEEWECARLRVALYRHAERGEEVLHVRGVFAPLGSGGVRRLAARRLLLVLEGWPLEVEEWSERVRQLARLYGGRPLIRLRRAGDEEGGYEGAPLFAEMRVSIEKGEP